MPVNAGNCAPVWKGMTAHLLAALLFASAPRYTMHEWGTFTSVAGEDGAALQWRPLEGQSDLPSFVHDMKDYGEGTRWRWRPA